MRVIVIGGGIAGLTAALRLAQNGVPVEVLESSAGVGGKLALSRQLRPEGDLDVGAESMLARRPEAVALLDELGLAGETVHPGPAGPLILSRGALHRMPAGTVMGVPLDVAAVERMRGLLTDEEMAEALSRGTAPAAPVTADLSVGSWVTSRLGRAVLDRMVEPLLGGVYAGHADQLSLQATVPALWQRAVAGGPLLADPTSADPTSADPALVDPVPGGAGPVPGPPATPVFAGLLGGVGRLPELLARRLCGLGVTIRTGVTVRMVGRSRGGWRVETGPVPAPDIFYADALVIAVPPAAAAKLLADPLPDAGALLSRIGTASTAVISTLVPRAQLEGLDASGVLVPPVEQRLVKALTFSSMKWPWLDERLRPAGLHAVRLSVGRAGQEQELQRTDDDLVAAALADLPGVLGRTLEPVRAEVRRWGGALPQYEPGHVGLVAELRRSVAAAGGMAICGAALDGVGIPAVIGSGERAAADLLRADLLRVHDE